MSDADREWVQSRWDLGARDRHGLSDQQPTEDLVGRMPWSEAVSTRPRGPWPASRIVSISSRFVVMLVGGAGT